jgi:putative spermidine/putrescine transport system permease protein
LAVDAARAGSSLRGARLRASAAFWRWPGLKLAALLSPPVVVFVCVYVAALVALLVSSLWAVDAFTGKTVHTWTIDNFEQILGIGGGPWDPTYLRIAGRTVGIAAAVTVTDAIVAFPIAFFMARLASPRTRAALFLLVLLPLWSSYLVRVYSWRTILAENGAVNWALNGLGLPDTGIAYTPWAMWVVFSYVWLPFMILPVVAAIERIPDSLLEASTDLGARGLRTFRSVILPLALPGVMAGSIFTFSLTLGDFITPFLVGGPDSTFVGNVVEENAGGNLPFAAALASVPLLVMILYLALAKRLGAFEAV